MTFDPIMTPNPRDEDPENAATMPMDSSGKIVITPAKTKLEINSDKRKNLAIVRRRLMASSAQKTTMINPTPMSKIGTRTIIITQVTIDLILMYYYLVTLRINSLFFFDTKVWNVLERLLGKQLNT